MRKRRWFFVAFFESQIEALIDVPGYSHCGEERRVGFAGRTPRPGRRVLFTGTSRTKIQRHVRQALETNPRAADEWDLYLQGFNVVCEVAQRAPERASEL